MNSGQDERKERLAQALRDNLRRRKAQARAGTADSKAAGRSRDGDARRHDDAD